MVKLALLFGKVRIAEMRGEGADGANRRCVQVRIAKDGVIDDVADAVNAVQAQDRRCVVAGVATVEHAAMQLHCPRLLLVRGPRDAKARREIQQRKRIVLCVVPKSIGDGEVGPRLPGFLREEGLAALIEVDVRITGHAGKRGGRSARKVQQSAAVLLQAGDRCRGAGNRVAVRVQHGREAAAKGVQAVEVLREAATLEAHAPVHTGLQRMRAMRPDGVVVDFEAIGVGDLRPKFRAASGECACNLYRHRGAVRRVDPSHPAPAKACFVHQVG